MIIHKLRLVLFIFSGCVKKISPNIQYIRLLQGCSQDSDYDPELHKLILFIYLQRKSCPYGWFNHSQK